MASRAANFAAHLDRLSGDYEAEVFRVASTRPDLPDVTALRYLDIPENGLATTITYGVSLARHADWPPGGGAELCMCVRSQDPTWPRALGLIAEQLRGVCPFAYGNTIDFGERIAPDTAMTAFLVFASSVVEREDAIGIDVAEPGTPPDLITIQGVYPIHELERQYIDAYGLEGFWHMDWDTYDVARPPAV